MSDFHKDEQGISELFERYADGYDDYSLSAILSCFTFPCVIWQADKGHIFEDEDQMTENIQALLDVYEDNNIAQSIYEEVDLYVQPTAATITLDWQQEDEEGEPVFDFTCHYNLVRIGRDWKIASIVNEPS
ncbi:hypothetical protein [Polycladidibacter hongkongensis]|uniref:hypothetical protein n=1 Tax=Polycladidibacter hongkongensis TaxID=1647556 RepID=UPI00082A5446|nr:hypothetical protein [Pseudovibrio hongkongensis]